MASRRSARDTGSLGYLVPLWVGGCILLGATAAVSLWARLEFATTGFCLLVVIVLLSLLDSFISSAIFAITGAGLLNFLFTPPFFSFRVQKAEDLTALMAFFITSIAVTALVRRLRRAESIQREQAQLLDLTHDTVFVRDGRDVIRFWNHAAESLYGWPKSEAIGKNAHELLKTAFPVPRDELQQALLRDGYWEGELVHTKRDGTEVVVTSRWTLKQDDRGVPLATLETNNDITQRKHAEDRLRRSQAQYLAEAQKLSRTGSFGWNVSTGKVFWSEQAFDIFEYERKQEPTIELVRQRVHPDDLPVFEQMLSAVNGSEDNFDIEHRLLFPDGRVKQLHVVARVGPNGAPDSRQFIGAVMDVTAARQTEDQLSHIQGELARASRVTALGELSASIAHEVGQPLAAIVTNAEAGLLWLHRQPLNVDELDGCLTQIADEGSRAAGIVQRVRQMMKGAPPERSPIDMNEAIREAVVLIRRDLELQKVALHLELGSGLSLVSGDKILLQQVIINLAMNAAQAMSSESGRRELTIASNQNADGTVLVALRDTGPGIKAENLPHLFEAFFTTRSVGLGMGLAICSSIIDGHEGQISAESNPDGGATFSFSLPSAPETVHPAGLT